MIQSANIFDLGKKHRTIFFGVALFFSVGLICCFRLISPFTFYNNDDVYLQMIVSGDISGTPSPYMIFCHYLLGFVLSRLYWLWPAMPWYGIWVCFCVGFCIFCITWRILTRCQKLWQAAVGLLLECILAFCIIFPVLCRAQWTVLAGLLGATALFWALTMDMSGERLPSRSMVILCCLAVMTYMIRNDVFFMLLPFAGVLWIGKFFLTEGKKDIKKKILQFSYPMMVLLGLMLLLYGSQKMAYSDDEWKEFMQFSKVRSSLCDYTGFPYYEKEQEFYESMGITEASFISFAYRYMFLNNPDVTLENFTKIAQKAEEQYNNKKTVPELFQFSLSRLGSLNFRLLSFLILTLYVGIVAYAVLSRRFQILIPPVLLFLMQTVVWMYLYGQGRFPDRVANGLYFIELFALLAVYVDKVLFVQNSKAVEEPVWKAVLSFLSRYVCWGAAALCVLLCLHYGGTIIKENSQKSLFSNTFNENYRELAEYCYSKQPDHFLVDLYATAYYSKDLLACRRFWPENMLSLGGWAAGSPLTQERLSDWGVEDVERAVIENPHIYVIFGESSEFTCDYFINYYQEKFPGCTFRLADTLTCSSGAVFYIYQGEMS